MSLELVFNNQRCLGPHGLQGGASSVGVMNTNSDVLAEVAPKGVRGGGVRASTEYLAPSGPPYFSLLILRK